MLLDTNIISELMRSVPNSHVVNWLNTQSAQACYLSSITLAEIEYGIAVLPYGQKRDTLAIRFKQFVNQGFGGRVLAFDEQSAEYFARVMSLRQTARSPDEFSRWSDCCYRASAWVASRDS
jgi:Predicted nucleic acid-binding protein, contains PIN domain